MPLRILGLEKKRAAMDENNADIMPLSEAMGFFLQRLHKRR